MKNRKLISALLAVGLAVSPVLAQPPGMGGGTPGVSPALLKMFGNNKTFTAKVATTIDGGRQTISMDMNIALLEGKMRAEMDYSEAKGIPAAGLARMKQMGMEKVVNIERPDTKMSLVVFPAMQAFSETPYDPARAKAATADVKIEKTVVGSETLDGHPCKRNKLVITGENGEKHEAMTWNAQDLKDFPVQIEMNENSQTIKMHFTNIKLDKPDAKLFEAPEGF
jgi:hypothetical protein